MNRANNSPSYFTIDHLPNSLTTKINTTPTTSATKVTRNRRTTTTPDILVRKSNNLSTSRSIFSPAFSPMPERRNELKENSARKLKRHYAQEEIASSTEDLTASITVAVRVRPFTEQETVQYVDDHQKIPCPITVDSINGRVAVQDRNDVDANMQFSFDHCFNSICSTDVDFCGQEKLYEHVGKPLLDKALNGFNVCMFAYGQTGSGKSYTIMGTDKDNGIIPRFTKELFLEARKQDNICLLEASFYEIYNEKIYDLLCEKNLTSGERTVLRIREHPQTGPYVENLTTKTIESIEQIFSLLIKGNRNRATAVTSMNDRSSRSHAIFTIQLTRQKPVSNLGAKRQTVQSLLSKINFVDLAGSERAAILQSTGERLKEGNLINKSLLTLGKVITMLSEADSNAFIPYRDSPLTFLLKECLGGNSSTCMIATISPAMSNLEETLSTLRYASKARKIVNKIKNNFDGQRQHPYQEQEPSSSDQQQILINVESMRTLVQDIQIELNVLAQFCQELGKNSQKSLINQVTNIFDKILND